MGSIVVFSPAQCYTAGTLYKLRIRRVQRRIGAACQSQAKCFRRSQTAREWERARARGISLCPPFLGHFNINSIAFVFPLFHSARSHKHMHTDIEIYSYICMYVYMSTDFSIYSHMCTQRVRSIFITPGLYEYLLLTLDKFGKNCFQPDIS